MVHPWYETAPGRAFVHSPLSKSSVKVVLRASSDVALGQQHLRVGIHSLGPRQHMYMPTRSWGVQVVALLPLVLTDD